MLEVQNLSVHFGHATAVDNISFVLAKGETLGLVGESGCGKSTTALALMRLLRDAEITGRASLDGVDLIGVDERTVRRMRGGKIGMIFQDPASALHPMMRVGHQVEEALMTHLNIRVADARARALDLFRKVGIAAPEERLAAYPHQLSGGMCQRVVIAMAIACSPGLLLADEPTTALDVTVQAQILELLRKISQESGAGMILITHDLGVVAGMTDRVAVMYAGRIVESGPTDAIFANPMHPYTVGLLASIPQLDGDWEKPVPTIPGSVGSISDRTACLFLPRCPLASNQCAKSPPEQELEPGHTVACWKAEA